MSARPSPGRSRPTRPRQGRPSRARPGPPHRDPLEEAGGAAVEFAVVLPGVLLVLALCLGGVRAAAVRLLAQDAAADAARSLARGDPSSVADRRVAAVPGADWHRSDRGDLVCVTVGAAPWAGIRVSAEACALAGGR